VLFAREDDYRTLVLAEEAILSDRDRTHARRELADGTVLDLTVYDEFGVLFTFRELPSGERQFLDYVMFSD
jgi:hypothetical protein